eukprot:4091912-Prymnesium_polylepis.1
MPRYLPKQPKLPCDTRLVTWVATNRQSYGCGIRPRPAINKSPSAGLPRGGGLGSGGTAPFRVQ